jgi:PPK2 family polyphosphate:nucleotide phosphotransferase
MKDKELSKSLIKHFAVPPGSKVSLKKDYDPATTLDVKKSDAGEILAEDVRELAELQEKLYAQNTNGVLIIFQAMDAAGKDSTIKHVMSGLNPQGCQVYSFKAPSPEEVDHDFLWRSVKALPERGRFGIHNRSYYEEVLIVRVHPEILTRQQLPVELTTKKIWKRRYESINNLEHHLTDNGFTVLKFFLNVSKAEQKKRFLDRIDLPAKNWKFGVEDAKERGHWDEYMHAYEEAFQNTSTDWAPWYIIPADNKWFTRLAVANIINSRVKELNPTYPTLSGDAVAQLQESRRMLESEPE